MKHVLHKTLHKNELLVHESTPYYFIINNKVACSQRRICAIIQSFENELLFLPRFVGLYEGASLLEKASGDLRAFQEQHLDNAEFQIEINSKIYTDRAEAGAEIEKALIKCSTAGESISLGIYFCFDLTIEKNQVGLIGVGTACSICMRGQLKYDPDLSLNNPIGNIRRIENMCIHLWSKRNNC